MTRPYTSDGDPGDPTGDRLVLGERYELLEFIGRGGMAEVYRAYDHGLARPVAVKLLPADRRHDDTESLRLQDEARAAAGLSHPHVIAVHDVGISARGIYVVMELLNGRTWRDVLREQGRLPEVEVARVGAAVGSALGHAHGHGIVHRDVNPSNVMLLADGNVKLMDFGIAKISGRPGLTASGSIVGTAAYLSPEQARGDPLDGRSDVYSLGCTLYEVLTGSVPFAGAGSADLAAARLREPPVPPRQVCPAVSVGMDDVVLRAMALDPRDRPDAASMAAMLRELVERSPHGKGGSQVVDRDDRTRLVESESETEPCGEAEAGGESEPAIVPSADTTRWNSRMRRAGIALIIVGVLALVVLGVLFAVR